MKVYHAISIDLLQDDSHAGTTVIGAEGDSGTHILQLQLLAGGQSWKIPEDVEVMIHYARHDGTGSTYNTLPGGRQAWELRDNALFIELAPDCFAVPTPPAQAMLLSVTLLQGEKQLTTRRISLTVQRALTGEQIPEESYLSLESFLTQYLGQMTELNTAHTDTVVGAVNEVLEKCRENARCIGSLEELNTADQSSLTAALNEAIDMFTTGMVSISDVKVSADGALLITLSDGAIINAGYVGNGEGSATVCGKAPNAAGDIPLTASDVGALSTGGGSLSGEINMNGNRITGLGDPSSDTDAVSKGYVTQMLQRAGENLLDNWYFENPVNQHGRINYEFDGPAYDRWILKGDAYAEASYTGLTFYCNSYNVSMSQYLENPKVLNGQTVTASAVLTENTGDFYMQLLHVRDETETVLGSVSKFTAGVATFTCSIEKLAILSGDKICFRFGNHTVSGRVYVIPAVKLEIGSQQTLAHQSGSSWVLNEVPRYDQQLLQCMRFFRVFKTESARPSYAQDFSPPMRAEPTLSTMQLGNDIYYTASAEL